MLRFSSAFHYKAMDFTMSMVMDKAGNVGRGWIAVLQRMLLRRLGFWNCTAYLFMSKFLELEISELIRVLQASEIFVAESERALSVSPWYYLWRWQKCSTLFTHLAVVSKRHSYKSKIKACWQGARISFMDWLSLTSWSLWHYCTVWTQHHLATARARLQQRCSAFPQQLSASAHGLRAFMTGGLCLSFAISKQNILISSLRYRRK